MNNAVYNFPNSNPLTCVWIETGNPRQPLVRVWIDAARRLLQGTTGATSVKSEVEELRLCA